MARISTRLRPLALLAPLAAQRADAQTPSATPVASPVVEPVPWLEIIDKTWAAIQTYYGTDRDLYKPHYPAQAGDNPYCYLWPFGAVLSAARARAEILKKPEADVDLVRALKAVAAYRHSTTSSSGYDSYVVSDGGGDRFYDDNMWIGIDAVLASRHLAQPQWVGLAQDIWAYLETGWTDDMGGGFYWKEGDLTTKNTCSNGPAAVLACLLYQETGRQNYLDWAVKIIGWLDKTLFDANSGVYSDNIKTDGTVESTQWTYNAGTPLQAKALLWEITREQRYLDEARALAAASLVAFGAPSLKEPIRLFPNTPWFNSILQRGFAELHRVDPELPPETIAALPTLLRWGWTHARDTETNILAEDWSWTDKPQSVEVLQVAPAIEIAATALHAGLE